MNITGLKCLTTTSLKLEFCSSQVMGEKIFSFAVKNIEFLISSKPYWGCISTSTEMPLWNISTSTDVPLGGHCMNTGYHYNFIALGYEKELLHKCIDMLHM